jgi:hypothetical protein
MPPATPCRSIKSQIFGTAMATVLRSMFPRYPGPKSKVSRLECEIEIDGSWIEPNDSPEHRSAEGSRGRGDSGERTVRLPL